MKFDILKHKLVTCIVSAVVITVLLSLLLNVGFLSTQSTKASDLLYSEQKALGEIVIVSIDDQSINSIGRWPWSREVFAIALQNLNSSKVIGVDVSFFESGEGDEALEEVLLEQKNVILVSECNNFLDKACEEWFFPVFNVSNAAANIYVDSGIARSVPGILSGVKSLSLAVSEVYLNTNVSLGEKNHIYFHESYVRIPFSEVLSETFDSSSVDGKIVLIGATAKNLHDEKETPIGVLPGVEIHANAVQSIISGEFLHYQSKSGLILTILFLSLVTALLMYYFRLIIAAIGSLILILLHVIHAIFGFDQGLIMNLLYPISSVILTYFLIVGLYYTTEAREKKWIAQVFGKYVSPNVAKQIMKEGAESLHLKGSKKIVTSLFADVRGFTAMSEKLSPEKVVSLLNNYSGISQTYIGVLLKKMRLKTLERPFMKKRVVTPDYKKEAIGRSSGFKMGHTDIAYFLSLSQHIVSQRRGKSGQHVIGYFGTKQLGYSLATQIYEAESLGFNKDETCELLDLRKNLVGYTLKNKKEIKGKLIPMLNILYSDRVPLKFRFLFKD